jgi:hypothetical protein
LSTVRQHLGDMNAIRWTLGIVTILIATLGVIYAIAWFVFYYRTVWAGGVAPPAGF